ncbi:MAG TPA: TolC family protein [Salegentibacter sp.]|nr:TolC family protein [Salegentibacter sp.]
MQKNFNLLLNRNITAKVVIQDTLVFNKSSDEISAKDPFQNHPELQMIDREVEANQSQAEVAQKEGLPMLGLGLEYTIFSKNDNASSPMNGQNMIMPMVSVSLPIFRKKYKAARKEAELMQTASLQNREARKNQLQGVYEQTRYEFNKAEKLLDLYNRQIQSSGQANKLLVSGFGNNTEEFEEVLRMNQDILMLNTQKLAALKNGFIAQAKLDYLSSKTENYDENIKK